MMGQIVILLNGAAAQDSKRLFCCGWGERIFVEARIKLGTTIVKNGACLIFIYRQFF